MRIVGTLGALPLLIACAVTPLASAAPDSAEPVAAVDFYTPPSPLPSGTRGDVIRTEPSVLAASVPGSDGTFPGTATRIMYRSEDTHGQPIAVTGTYLDPSLPWKGEGSRPLVSFAPGTQGQGDQCAPSKTLTTLISYTPPTDFMVGYEALAIDALLAQGIAVVVTDLEGLGTPGVHTYANRLAGAHAVLDAARAARQLPGTALADDGPIGLWGYSLGGGAVAAAAELAENYAPELDIKGTYAGSPPVDLAATLVQGDGGLGAGALGYAINGIAYAYPQIKPVLDEITNDAGKRMLADVATQCIPETILKYGLHHLSEYMKEGRPLDELIAGLPAVQEVLEANRIGSLTPNAPVLIQSGTSDDLVPHAPAKKVAAHWCEKGATVQFTAIAQAPILPGSLINHGVPILTGVPEALTWMTDRFTGKPTPRSCG